MKNVILSIIVVNYKVKNELLTCIESIYKSKPRINFEIIVVDNDENKTIEGELKNKFKYVKYIKSEKNLGFGGGNNLGASFAQGDYLFFLNPDTKILDGALDSLHSFFIKNKNVGIVSPVFLDSNLKPFKSQGSKELTPKNFIFSQSFLRKIFPYRNIYNENALFDWSMKFPRETDTVPGAAMMISSNLFKKIGGFDEKFFLYFEENDISKRIRGLGYKLYIEPSAKIIHLVGKSTRHFKNIENIYSKSRYLYLRKHYGLFRAMLIHITLSVNKTFIFVLSILTFAFFLRVINLENNMSFIGDQGWFYLSARDMILTGKIPLVGITSSHTWLHQGPLWTYMLSIPLAIFKFNPVSGGYLTAILGTITVFLLYRIGSELFSVKSGLIASLLYAVSPLVIAFDRMPYHTSPIPLFTTLYFYALFKWINGKANYFPVAVLLLAILYNLELATFVLFFPFAILFMYGLFNRKSWVTDTLNKKIVMYSLIFFAIPMLPVIIYDLSNGFKQTIIFLGWTLYKPFSFFINHSLNNFLSNTSILMNFIFVSIQKLIISSNLFISLFVFSLSILLLIHRVFNREKLRIKSPTFLLIFLLTFSLAGIFISQTPSDAYLPIIFPFVVFSVALLFDFLFEIKQIRYFFILVFVLMVSLNIRSGVQNDMINGFRNKIQAVDEIINLTKNKKYNLVGKGAGSQFKSFTMNYEYLLWWKGHPPSQSQENLKIILSESSSGIKVEKK